MRRTKKFPIYIRSRKNKIKLVVTTSYDGLALENRPIARSTCIGIRTFESHWRTSIGALSALRGETPPSLRHTGVMRGLHPPGCRRSNATGDLRFTQMYLRRTLADGSTVDLIYGCHHTNPSFDTIGTLQPHLAVHTPWSHSGSPPWTARMSSLCPGTPT